MPKMTDTVLAGAELLDNALGRKTWDRDIDLDSLELGSCEKCILGQLYEGDFAEGLNDLERLGYQGVVEDTSAFGFSLSASYDSRRWGALTRTWKRVIRERIEARRRRR